MKKKLIYLIITISLLIAGYFYVIQDFEKNKITIYSNGNIITIDKKLPSAQAMLVKNGKIKAIGSNDEILQLKTDEIELVDLKGATVLPGFIDVHTHASLSTFLVKMVDLSGFKHNNNNFTCWRSTTQTNSIFASC